MPGHVPEKRTGNTMNCQEAQSNIMNYINHHLSNEQTKSFIEHIRSCPDCQDELEINYIVMVGLQQLDDGEIMSVDFRKKLKEDINLRYDMVRKEEERSHSLRVIIIAFLISLTLWLLSRGLAFIL